MRQRPVAEVLPPLAEAADSPAAVSAVARDNVELRAHSDMDGPLNISIENYLKVFENFPTFLKIRVYLSESFQKR